MVQKTWMEKIKERLFGPREWERDGVEYEVISYFPRKVRMYMQPLREYYPDVEWNHHTQMVTIRGKQFPKGKVPGTKYYCDREQHFVRSESELRRAVEMEGKNNE